MSEFELVAYVAEALSGLNAVLRSENPEQAQVHVPVDAVAAIIEAADSDELGTGPLLLSCTVEIGGKTHAKGSRISAEMILKTADKPARTLILGHITGAGAPRRGELMVFCTTSLEPGETLTIAEIKSMTQPATLPNRFARGTQIDTPHGEIAIEDLDAGDEILTIDGKTQLISWIGHARFSALELALEPLLRPMRIRAGALPGGRPGQDLLVSQSHRLLLDDWRAAYLYGEDEILVPACSLHNGHSVCIACPPAGIDYFHIMTERSSLVCANGLWAETLIPDHEGLAALPEALQQDAAAALNFHAPSPAALHPAFPALSGPNSSRIAA